MGKIGHENCGGLPDTWSLWRRQGDCPGGQQKFTQGKGCLPATLWPSGAIDGRWYHIGKRSSKSHCCLPEFATWFHMIRGLSLRVWGLYSAVATLKFLIIASLSLCFARKSCGTMEYACQQQRYAGGQALSLTAKHTYVCLVGSWAPWGPKVARPRPGPDRW